MECLIELSRISYWVSSCSECESFLESCAIWERWYDSRCFCSVDCYSEAASVSLSEVFYLVTELSLSLSVLKALSSF
jgi:hypothetical protein